MMQVGKISNNGFYIPFSSCRGIVWRHNARLLSISPYCRLKLIASPVKRTDQEIGRERGENVHICSRD